MKRRIVYLLTGATTFFLGITPQLFFKPQATTQPPPAVAVERVRQNPKVTSKVRIESPPPRINFDYDPDKFNPRGDYYLIGRKPKGFREFDLLELAVEDADGNAMIQTYDKGEYRSYYVNSGSITSKHLTFVTYPRFRENFVYSFEGQFLRKGTLSKARKYVAVLKGTLRKSKASVTIAEATVKFRIEYLGC